MSATISRSRRSKGPSVLSILSTIVRYTLLIFLSILFLVPFYIIIRNGLATDADITSRHWSFFPTSLHFENIQELFDDTTAPFLGGLLNSAWIAIAQTIGQVVIAAMAGYGLARIPNRWSNVVFYAVLITLMIPSAVTFVPTFVIVSYIGWASTLQGIIVPTLFSGFATFLFRQFFLSFPAELEEAGRIDGLSYWGVFRRIVVPNSLTIFAALGVITFIASWNSFLWPLVVGQDESTWTVQVVLSTFMTGQTINLHELFIGAAIAILPLVLVFFFLQRYIVEGYAQSGIKG